MIRNAVLLSFSVLVLSACVTLENAGPIERSAAGGGGYLALGNEPGWSLEITPQRLNYVGAYGATKIVEVNPGARTSFNGQRYEGTRLTVDVTHDACSDGMSERRYADRVTVTADGATYSGCGGAILPPANLAGTRWRMLTIEGKSVDPTTRTSLGFDGQTMSGSAGCNRFSAGYASDGTRLSTGPIVATKKGCTGPAATQETAAFSILAKPVTIRFAIDGKMILMGAAGRSIVLEATT